MLQNSNIFIDQNFNNKLIPWSRTNIQNPATFSRSTNPPCLLLNQKVPTCHSSRQHTPDTLTYLKGLTKVSTFKTWLKTQVSFGWVTLAQTHLIGIQQHPIKGTISTVRIQHATLTLWHVNREYDATIITTCGQACYKKHMTISVTLFTLSVTSFTLSVTLFTLSVTLFTLSVTLFTLSVNFVHT
jgi:hypothetical protein